MRCLRHRDNIPGFHLRATGHAAGQKTDHIQFLPSWQIVCDHNGKFGIKLHGIFL